MALSDAKKAFGEGGMGQRPEKAPALPPKEDAFGKSGYMSQDRARGLLRNSKNLIYERYRLKGTEVDELGRKITDPKKFGGLTDKYDVEKYERDERKKINKITNLDEKARAKTKLEKELLTVKGLFLNKK